MRQRQWVQACSRASHTWAACLTQTPRPWHAGRAGTCQTSMRRDGRPQRWVPCPSQLYGRRSHGTRQRLCWAGEALSVSACTGGGGGAQAARPARASGSVSQKPWSARLHQGLGARPWLRKCSGSGARPGVHSRPAAWLVTAHGCHHQYCHQCPWGWSELAPGAMSPDGARGTPAQLCARGNGHWQCNQRRRQGPPLGARVASARASSSLAEPGSGERYGPRLPPGQTLG